MRTSLKKDAKNSYSNKRFFKKGGEGSFFQPVKKSEDPFFLPSGIGWPVPIFAPPSPASCPHLFKEVPA